MFDQLHRNFALRFRTSGVFYKRFKFFRRLFSKTKFLAHFLGILKIMPTRDHTFSSKTDYNAIKKIITLFYKIGH